MTFLKLSVYILSIFALPSLSIPAPAPVDDGYECEPQETYPQPSETRYFQIHPGYNKDKCLDVRGGEFVDGTPVDIFDCNGTPAQNWSIERGATKVKVAGQNYCLDAADPKSGTQMIISMCYGGSFSPQAWYYTDDNRIALDNQGQCLDLTDGGLEDGNVMQIWECTDGNTNQIWTV